ncbi:MAG: sugar phosphate isomerase/epimerase family protein [Candidatus Krumholzibacteriia bacterium]
MLRRILISQEPVKGELARGRTVVHMIFHASVLLDELEDKFDSIARAGFNPEVRMRDAGHLMELADADVARMGKLLAARSLATFTHGPFLGLDIASLDAHIAEYSAACLARGLEVTAGLGGSVMVVHTNYSPRFSRAGLREWLGNWSVRMGPILEKARGLGVRIALENVWEERPEELARLIEVLPDREAMVCLDTGHINAFSRLPVARWWELLGERVIALHLHDNDGSSDDHLPPGRGIFDFPALAEILRGRAPLPLMTFEVDVAGAIEGRAYLEALFSERT